MRFAMMIAAALLAPAVQGAGAAGLQAYLAKAELAPLAAPGAALPFVFKAQAEEDATLEVSLDDAGMAFAEDTSGRYLLRLQASNPAHEIQVRQRSLVYMNLGDEGPHVAIPATERRGPWQAARPRTRDLFEVGGLPAPALALSRAQLLDAVRRSEAGREARWRELARRCKAADDGPCYTITDSEYEVTVRAQGRVLARGVLRLRQPNGC